MSREIKFRAWDLKFNKMHDWEKLRKSPPCHWDLSCEPMQYTGLKDKNGIDIYEGDILGTSNENPKYDVWDLPDFGYTVVEWDSKYTCFQGSKWMWDMANDQSVYDLQFIEVIGNIYANPELLEAKHD